MVKRSRLQSSPSPRRCIWPRILPPYSSFHCHTRATNASRPRSRRLLPSLASFAFDDVLGGDPGVVHPGQPQRVEALHAPAPSEGVHERVLEGMPEVQRAGHVRRRDHDRERSLARRRVGLENPQRQPPSIGRSLDRGRVVRRPQIRWRGRRPHEPTHGRSLGTCRERGDHPDALFTGPRLFDAITRELVNGLMASQTITDGCLVLRYEGLRGSAQMPASIHGVLAPTTQLAPLRRSPVTRARSLTSASAS
jgi:hypothetical protein